MVRNADAIDDWRKGVELIASALGEVNPPNLSCVRLSERALRQRAVVEEVQSLLLRWLHAMDIPVDSDGAWKLSHEHVKALYAVAGVEEAYREECDPETY